MAEPHRAAAESKPEKLLRHLNEVVEEIARLSPSWAAEEEKFDRAKRIETDRRALEMQPLHREAVREMLAAAEGLSAAIVKERALLNQLFPLRESKCLPNCGGDLDAWVGTFEEAGSVLSHWRKRITALGYSE